MTQRADTPHARKRRPIRKNHTKASTDLKDDFKGPDPKPIKKPKKGK